MNKIKFDKLIFFGTLILSFLMAFLHTNRSILESIGFDDKPYAPAAIPLALIVFCVIQIFSGKWTHATISGQKDRRYKNNRWNSELNHKGTLISLKIICASVFSLIIYFLIF